MSELLESGEVVPVVDRCFPLRELPEALRYRAAGHAGGKVIIAMAHTGGCVFSASSSKERDVHTFEKTAHTEARGVTLSTVWIFVVINIVVADIIGFLNPGALEAMMTGSTGFEITQGLILVFAVLFQIPIAMIPLSRILPYRVNRWANIIASVITILSSRRLRRRRCNASPPPQPA